ncbi:hypothetical protein P7C70_g8165, partial [Phenoliferia sp. Uapishka_3]
MLVRSPPYPRSEHSNPSHRTASGIRHYSPLTQLPSYPLPLFIKFEWLEVVDAVASSNFLRVSPLLRRLRRWNRGPREITKAINEVASGLTRYDEYSDLLLDIGAVIRWLAGARPYETLHNGVQLLPSISTISRLYRPWQVTILFQEPTAEEVEANTRNGLPLAKGPTPWILAVDELHQDPYITMAQNHRLLGIDFSGDQVNPEITSYQQLLDIHADLKAGRLRRVKEGSGYFLVANSKDDSGPIVVCFHGTCGLGANAVREAQRLQMIRDTVQKVLDERGEGEFVACFAQDGASARMKAVNLLVYSHEMADVLPKVFNGMRFFPMAISKDGEPIDADFRHVIKRECDWLVDDKGVTIGNILLTWDVITMFLLEYDDQLSFEHLEKLKHGDKMDVDRGTEVPARIGEAGTRPRRTNSLRPVEMTKALQDQYRVFQYVAVICDAQNRAYFHPNLDISDVRTVNIVTCRLKTLAPEKEIYIFKVGQDPVEGVYGTVRTIVGNTSLTWMGRMGQVLTAAQGVNKIYASRPTLRPRDKRHQLIKNFDILGGNVPKLDHIAVRDVTGDQRAGSVDHRKIWNEEIEYLAARSAELGFPFNEAATFALGVDILAPIDPNKQILNVGDHLQPPEPAPMLPNAPAHFIGMPPEPGHEVPRGADGVEGHSYDRLTRVKGDPLAADIGVQTPDEIGRIRDIEVGGLAATCVRVDDFFALAIIEVDRMSLKGVTKYSIPSSDLDLDHMLVEGRLIRLEVPPTANTLGDVVWVSPSGFETFSDNSEGLHSFHGAVIAPVGPSKELTRLMKGEPPGGLVEWVLTPGRLRGVQELVRTRILGHEEELQHVRRSRSFPYADQNQQHHFRIDLDSAPPSPLPPGYTSCSLCDSPILNSRVVEHSVGHTAASICLFDRTLHTLVMSRLSTEDKESQVLPPSL